MEKMNKRYIEIDSCLKCEHSGHISNSGKDGITFICSHPANMSSDMPREFICSHPAHMSSDMPREFIGKTAYPIVVVEQNNTVHICRIPSWCTLPKEVVIFDRNAE